jgi:hypothetical protein
MSYTNAMVSLLEQGDYRDEVYRTCKEPGSMIVLTLKASTHFFTV